MTGIPPECRSAGCIGAPRFHGFCIVCATSRPSWRVIEARNDPDAEPAPLDPATERRLQPIDDLPVCDYWPTCTADDEPCEDCRAHARQRADNTGEPLLGASR